MIFKKTWIEFFLNAIFLFLKILYFLFMIFFCEISHVSAMVLHNYVIFIYKKLTGAIFNIRKEKKKNLHPFHFSWLKIP
jgi:hypothetical protein